MPAIPTTDLNPFIYDDPVPPEELIDREREVKQLFDLAVGSHNSRLQGPRRYGKTSVLRRLVEEEADKAGFRTVYVDFLLATTPDEVARRLHEAYESSLRGSLGQMFAKLKRRWRGKVKAAPGGVGVEAEQTASTAARQQLADLLDLPRKILDTSGNRTIVVFDEFQDFLQAPGDLDGLLRSKIINHHDAASYVFCGSESALLESHFADRKKPLFDQARPLYLGPLDDGDLGDYIADRFDRTGRDPGEALELILNLARGHPQRGMLMAHHLWEQTPRGKTAEAETFDSALASIDREMGERFEYTWQQISKSANKARVLKALAISRETLFNQRTLSPFQMSKGQAQSGARQLTRDGEVWEANGRPQIIDPLLERWVQQREGRAA